MPKTKTTAPVQSHQKGQRSISDPLYLIRYPYYLRQPLWTNAQAWRMSVESQPVALLSRETLIGQLLSLDWKIEPRDSDNRDELKSEIDYYTRLFEYTGEIDYTEQVEWIAKDLLDLPFGGASEVGRAGDDPEGKVLWIEPLDGGTLFPTQNFDYPVGQRVNGVPREVYFPWYSIDRVFMSPRTEINRKGWGIAPPEKIYLSLEMVGRGDTYYANLLLDTPDAGILDLLDMSKDSAEEWVKAWRELLTGIDAYKIPVLYQHTTPAKWISFTRPPTEIMFDVAMMRYSAIVCAGYGLVLSDIGLGGSSGGGNTLAGTIRDERKSKRNGFTRIKRKMEGYFNRILPSTLKFTFIDLDDEMSVALGRARLANATAWSSLISVGAFTAKEARLQTIADGLTTISLPEEIPQDELPQNQNGNNPAERPSMLGRPVSPSSGGWGETAARSQSFNSYIDKYQSLEDKVLQRLAYVAFTPVKALVDGVSDALETDQLGKLIFDDVGDSVPELFSVSMKTALDFIGKELEKYIKPDVEIDRTELEQIYDEILSHVQEEIAVRSFVEGSCNVLPPVDKAQFVEKASQLSVGYAKAFTGVFARGVVLGMSQYMMEAPNTEIEEIYNPDLLQKVRNCVNDFAHQMKSDFIHAIIELL